MVPKWTGRSIGGPILPIIEPKAGQSQSQQFEGENLKNIYVLQMDLRMLHSRKLYQVGIVDSKKKSVHCNKNHDIIG